LSRFDPHKVTLHLNVAVLHCDSPVTLEETLLLLKDLALHIQRVGATSIAFPRAEFAVIERALHDHALFPRTIGKLPRPTEPSDPTPSD